MRWFAHDVGAKVFGMALSARMNCRTPSRGAAGCSLPYLKVSVSLFVRRFTEDTQKITGFWFIGLP